MHVTAQMLRALFLRDPTLTLTIAQVLLEYKAAQSKRRNIWHTLSRMPDVKKVGLIRATTGFETMVWKLDPTIAPKETRGRRTNNPARLRVLLAKNPDGLTSHQIGKHLGVTRGAATAICRRTKGVYIDRWVIPNGGSGLYAAVWCLGESVEAPKDCPPPPGRATRRKK